MLQRIFHSRKSGDWGGGRRREGEKGKYFKCRMRRDAVQNKCKFQPLRKTTFEVKREKKFFI